VKPYYEEDGITIYHGDCRDIVPLDIVPMIGAEFVMVTDPPYGTGQKIAYDVYKDTLDRWEPLMEWLLSNSCPMAFTMSHTRLFDLPKRPQWTGCWDKMFTGGITHVGASPTWEPICFYNLPAGDRGKARWDDIFRCPPAGFPFSSPRDLNGHPCPKPVKLYKQILGVMPPGVVIDPMMGSGTTLRAAKDIQRRAIGIDVSERYCEIAAKRLSQGVLDLTGTEA
jgi:DNA modification methylase